jgi:hypothetical protein
VWVYTRASTVCEVWRVFRVFASAYTKMRSPHLVWQEHLLEAYEWGWRGGYGMHVRSSE